MSASAGHLLRRIPVDSRLATRVRTVVSAMACSVVICAPALLDPPAAWADDRVTYEVVSDDINIANIEYEDTTGRAVAEGVALPWHTDAVVRTVRGAPPDGSQVRADWRPLAAPGRWVTVRIIYQGKLVCQSTLDVGNATCYGMTPRLN